MKTNMITNTLTAILLTSSIGLSLPSYANTISAEESTEMAYMREEEKVARDLYIMLNQQWNLRVFENISASEQHHSERMQALLNTYGIQDPVTNDEVGVFVNPKLNQLYQQLLQRGQQSELEALHVGALVEETDILDLRNGVANTTQTEAKQVYTNLLRASRNHLRAFAKQIQNNGGTYTAQLMSQEDVDAIINSPKERGAGHGKGHGGGKGQGGGRGWGQGRHAQDS